MGPSTQAPNRFAQKNAQRPLLGRYCTRLGQAQTEEDKTAVLEDMRNTPEAQAVLEARISSPCALFSHALVLPESILVWDLQRDGLSVRSSLDESFSQELDKASKKRDRERDINRRTKRRFF